MPKSYYYPHFVRYIAPLSLFLIVLIVMYLIILQMRQKQNKSKWKAFLESATEILLELLVHTFPLICLGIFGMLALAIWRMFNK